MCPAEIRQSIETPLLSVRADLSFIFIGQQRGPAEPISVFQGVPIGMLIESGNNHGRPFADFCPTRIGLQTIPRRGTSVRPSPPPMMTRRRDATIPDKQPEYSGAEAGGSRSGVRSAPTPYHPMDPIRARRRTRDSISLLHR